MKAAMAVLFILGTACLIIPAAALSSSGSMSIVELEKTRIGGSFLDTRSMEDKMADSLRGLGPQVPGAADDEEGRIINTGNMKARLPGSNLESSRFINPSSNNSSARNSSIFNSTALNSTAPNSTALNTSAVNASAPNGSGLKSTGASGSGAVDLSGSTEASSDGVSTSSRASVKGFYGITASRHEMGKSDIKSKMFLSGNFDVDKTVQFHDQGF